MRPANRQLAAYTALGRLIENVPQDIPVASWTLGDGVDARLVRHGVTDGELRERLRRLADVFGLEFGEKDHGQHQNIVTASGWFGGVRVRFWTLVAAGCTCGRGESS